MIPLGNIMPGDTCPWVSLRSTHGYKSDHPLRGCHHIYVIAGRNAGELPLAPTLPARTAMQHNDITAPALPCVQRVKNYLLTDFDKINNWLL